MPEGANFKDRAKNQSYLIFVFNLSCDFSSVVLFPRTEKFREAGASKIIK